MDEFGRALGLAVAMILRADPDLVAIVGLSLRVSLTAAGLGFVLGAPLGALLAATRCGAFRYGAHTCVISTAM